MNLQNQPRPNQELPAASNQNDGDVIASDSPLFTLPQQLLKVIEELFGDGWLSAEQLATEKDLATQCHDHTQVVGAWKGNPIVFYHLRREGFPQISEELRVELGWERQTVSNLRIAEERSAWVHEITKGYIGWLTTTRAFLSEHDELLSRHANAVRRWGLPGLRQAVSAVPDEVKRASPPEGLSELCKSVEEFCLRWRLVRLAAPGLPVPLQPFAPIPMPILAMGPMNTGGGLFYFPDTFAIPSRDMLRGILDEALRLSSPSHLADWTKLVSRDNLAKNQIARFGRLFEIQHYCRILQDRYPAAMHRSLGRLASVLASYFGVAQKTIDADMGLISKRLGRDWIHRPPSRF